uniref:DNA mismatch repair proteins mutS family domain-containing protein n=1 Tax=viral metagenome TaxID=1070528 RepID=A0A6C0M2T2_9ZZZZ
MSLVKEYFRLSKEAVHKYGPRTVLLMQVGAFYECYGETTDRAHIDEFCRTCELACANKAPGIIMAGFRDYSLEKYLNRLQEAGYTAVVHSQDAQIKEERALSGVYSPGTFFTAESVALSNSVACIWLERMRNKTIIGMANIDVFTGRSSVFETETELMHAPTTYDELERFISTHAPSEVILISENFSQKEAEDLLHFTGIATCARLIHRLDSADAAVQKSKRQVYQREIMARFFGSVGSVLQFATHEFATQALAYLLNFVHEHNPQLVHRIAEPAFENCSDRMVLANHSLKQLNIIDDDSSGAKGRCSSVFKLLNNCMTPMGARHFRTRLLNPSCCAVKIQREYDITAHLLSSTGVIDAWRPQLAQLKDLEKFSRLIMMRKCAPQMLHSFYGSLGVIGDLHSAIDSTASAYLDATNPTPNPTAWEPVSDICARLRLHLDTTFHMDKCAAAGADLGDCDFVRPGISAELDALRLKNETGIKTLSELRTYLNSLVLCGEKPKSTTSAGLTNLKYDGASSDVVRIHETPVQGLSLQATNRRTKLLADQIKQQKLDQVCIGGRGFSLLALTFPKATSANHEITSPQLDELCRGILASKQKIKECVAQIYADFVDKLRDWNPAFQQLIHFATTMDLLQNQCHIAVKYKFCKPVIVADSAKSFFDARDLRHCLIERINEDETYVANDVALGLASANAADAPQKDGMLIYGTNAVGKTSLIRAIGIAIIMAQAGLYVPCSAFRYHPYTTIFTRILGNDNLFKGLSTFQVEMSELRVILRTANERSLILGDELCSGTEMDSAIAIFVAGLTHLHKVGCTFLFATHMHEINGYDEVRLLTNMCMKHLTVVYDKAKDALVYGRKLADGPGASMYGLEVCKSLHLPDAFLEFANAVRLRHRAPPSDIGILSFEPSRFNAHKLKGVCERCAVELAQEIHHRLPQKDADSQNYIGHVPKNHVANLMALCTRCHDEVHGAGGELM